MFVFHSLGLLCSSLTLIWSSIQRMLLDIFRCLTKVTASCCILCQVLPLHNKWIFVMLYNLNSCCVKRSVSFANWHSLYFCLFYTFPLRLREVCKQNYVLLFLCTAFVCALSWDLTTSLKLMCYKNIDCSFQFYF